MYTYTDKHASRRYRQLHEDINKDCRRFYFECKDLGSHKISPEEEKEFLYAIDKNKIKGGILY